MNVLRTFYRHHWHERNPRDDVDGLGDGVLVEFRGRHVEVTSAPSPLATPDTLAGHRTGQQPNVRQRHLQPPNRGPSRFSRTAASLSSVTLCFSSLLCSARLCSPLLFSSLLFFSSHCSTLRPLFVPSATTD